jgi:hypothetical protein
MTRTPDAWNERDEEINRLEEYAIVQPYKELPGVDELSELTDRYYELEKEEHWQRRLADYLHRWVGAIN